ncbi:hypothetical protein [Actinokineospora globicatena]|uniref:hypothetical protein n=1 Tax=Actinokineospora globicatena TaxID=103729 RepID=UPI0020A4094B|nr:hypothetical protein [Actinokineospora globicatena]MCP2303782.1 hypothetical protein [Actinokineospora globicatena]GLW79066.1 hypothetical protein Aglo01_35480 [Actinokineospora globicatena]GLW86524.1 hypothetical protein Aglo02_41630 [Actinokineospora globicatena]
MSSGRDHGFASWRTTDQVHRFAFDARFRLPLRAVAVVPETAWVRVADGEFRARFGPWVVVTPVSNISGTLVTGPFSPWRAIGARLSLSDRGLTLGTTPAAGLCVRFHEPVPGLEPTGLLRHPEVTVTVAEPGALAGVLGHHA